MDCGLMLCLSWILIRFCLLTVLTVEERKNPSVGILGHDQTTQSSIGPCLISYIFLWFIIWDKSLAIGTNSLQFIVCITRGKCNYILSKAPFGNWRLWAKSLIHQSPAVPRAVLQTVSVGCAAAEWASDYCPDYCLSQCTTCSSGCIATGIENHQN